MKILLTVLLFFSFNSYAQSPGELLADIPVQDGGRIKPFDTFARESLSLIYGKQKFNGKLASEVVFTWILIPQEWMGIEVFEVRHSGLREALKLEDSKKIFHSFDELMSNPRIGIIFQELNNLLEQNEKLNPYFQAVQRLKNQLTVFKAIQTGEYLPLAPNSDPKNDKWVSVIKFEGDLQLSFLEMSKAFIQKLSVAAKEDARHVEVNEANHKLEKAVQVFKEEARLQNPAAYDDSTIKYELFLNKWHPFQWAWVLYLLATLFVIFSIVSKKEKYLKVFWWFTGGGMILHTLGMALRTIITERPPVSNMYETVVWVPWVAIIFAAILFKQKRNKLVLFGATLLSTFCLILTDLSPTVLDPSLQPLEAVLRDNFWLLTHVLIIVSSYSAFFLAFAISDILLFYYFRGEENYKQEIKEGVHAIYRSLQIGIVLLAAGTILGGVWADYSWGRFWGWDPKETWAFIALMGYLAILHGRLVGWVKDFGMVVCSNIAFSLVIMAWYGVNFVLGAGLHTYGFGAGGVEYVSGFVAVHLLLVTYVAVLRKVKSNEKN